ncbi:MAG: VanZ family protein [Bacteroidales bacterium]
MKLKIIRVLFGLQHYKFIFSTIITLLITILSLTKIQTPDEKEFFIPYADKFVHIIMYFVLSLTLLLEFSKSKNPKILRVILIYTILYGILMEVLQAFIFTYRSGDFYDCIFNTAGTIVAVLIFKKLKTYKEIIPS